MRREELLASQAGAGLSYASSMAQDPVSQSMLQVVLLLAAATGVACNNSNSPGSASFGPSIMGSGAANGVPGGGGAGGGDSSTTGVPASARGGATGAAGAGGAAGPAPDDLASLAVLLQKGQLKGWIHGAVHARGLYVFTYRKPGDFFTFIELPLTPSSDAVAAQLLTIKRHDAVVLQGSFIDSISPVPHIRLDNLSIITSYTPDESPPPRPAETVIPDSLAGQTEAIAKVHAIGDDGAMLVVEYGDAVVPVYVRVPALTAGLYRNDKIRLAFEFAPVPARPTHMWLDTAAAKPVEVLERLLDYNGKPFVGDGALVRFAKSEQISIDVYAVQVIDSDGISREYTLFNVEPTILTALEAKAAAAWKSRPGEGIDGRNKLVNPKIRVHAVGTFSIVDPNQANAQIWLDSPDNVTFTFVD